MPEPTSSDGSFTVDYVTVSSGNDRDRPDRWVERVVKRARHRLNVVAFLVSLSLGLVIAPRFAADARCWASDAEQEKKRAAESREQAEETLVRSLLQPLGQTTDDPNESELQALWKLAESPSPRVHQLFLELALERPATTRQLRNRSELAIHAAVGLDPARRRRLEEILLQRLKDETVEAKWRTDCALVALEVTRHGQELTQLTAQRLAEALAQDKDRKARSDLARALDVMAGELEPAKAAVLARPLVDALIQEKDRYNTRLYLTSALVKVAPLLGPVEASALARRLTDALIKETDRDAQHDLSRPLRSLAVRLEPAEATVLARRLEAELRSSLVQALGILGMTATRLEPAEVVQLLAQEKDSGVRLQLARDLARAADHLEPAVAAAAARPLADALAQEKNPAESYGLARELAAVAARLEPTEAARLAAAAPRIAEALAKGMSHFGTVQLAEGLGAILSQLEPATAARLAEGPARRLAADLAQAKDNFTRYRLAQALAALATHLDQATAAAVARQLEFALYREATTLRNKGTGFDVTFMGFPISSPTAFDVRFQLDRALSAVATRLGPAEAARLAAEAARLTAQERRSATEEARRRANDLAKEKDPQLRGTLANSLAAEAAWLEPADAMTLARRLADALAKETNTKVRFELAKGLAAAALSIDPAAAAPRSLLAAGAVAGWLSPSPQLGNVAMLLRAAEPLPCRFTTQQLVDLLKMPTCLGKSQTVFLELLSRRYKQSFADIWDFVAWAEKNEPGIDFKSPPKRNPLATGGKMP
jgi:hypothetical protein